MIGFNGFDWKPNLVVQSGTNYGDGIITGASAIVVNESRKSWSIFDLWTPIKFLRDEHLWLPVAERLGRGHLVRLVDSCLRLGIYPDPRQIGTSISPIERPDEFWKYFLQWAVELHRQALILNAEDLIKGKDPKIKGKYSRVYMRMLVTGLQSGVGPPSTDDPRPGTVQLILQPLGEYAAPNAIILPADTLTVGDPMARIKMTANYPGYIQIKHAAQKRAKICWGLDIDDTFSVKLGPAGQLLAGEASTSTLGGVWMLGNEPTVLVPDHVANNTLVGRTAGWILKIAEEELGLKAGYSALTLADLFCAQELWRSGNASYLAPISAIGGLSSETLRAAEIGNRINQLLLKTMKGEIYEAFSTRVCLSK